MDFITALKEIKGTNNSITNGKKILFFDKNNNAIETEKGSNIMNNLPYVSFELLLSDWIILTSEREKDLEDVIMWLTLKTFEIGKENCVICYNHFMKKWSWHYKIKHQHLGQIYFELDNIKEVVEFLNFHEITFEEFWQKFHELRGEL